MFPPLATFGTIVFFGVWGFMYLGNVGTIEAIFWLVDFTSIELHGASDTVKAYAIVVRVGLVVSSLWIAETVLSAAFGGQITEEFRRMQTQEDINRLSNHVVVCGYGMFGKTVAQGLEERGEDVVVVEMDENEHRAVLNDGFLGVEGDARREEVLRNAGVERAKSIVIAVDNSSVNVEIALVVSELAPNIRTVVRVGDEMFTPLARRAGADDVVIPEVMSGQNIVDLL